MQPTPRRLAFILFVLFGINLMNFFDRQVLGAVAEDVRREWHLSDTDIGALGTAFILLYAVVGVPIGRWADHGPRVKILAVGTAIFSVLTAASGFAGRFATLYVARLGVGIGEASCAPTASSLVGDLFPQRRRARALSVFMLGLPLGLALGFIVPGYIVTGAFARFLELFIPGVRDSSALPYVQGWRAAFYVAALPGLLLALTSLLISEPPRGTVERHAVGQARRPGSPILLVLKSPTMFWLIVSGALHNFNMYAIGTFLSSYFRRYHSLDAGTAGLYSGLVYGCGGGLGMLLGGWACDRVVRRRLGGRLEVASLGLLISIPCVFLALQYGPGNGLGFALWMLAGCSLFYIYYSAVYATIQDIIEPALRGTAMAVYFCAMYLVGAALGPWGTGKLSDFFRERALRNDQPAEWAAALGLHDALYIVPILNVFLVLVLIVASRTVTGDHERLEKWLHASGHDEGQEKNAASSVPDSSDSFGGQE